MAEIHVACPFVAGPPITDPARFIGRKALLQQMRQRARFDAPTSVNLFGERRIGKTSLLTHFAQTFDTAVPDSRRFAIVRLALYGGLTQPEVFRLLYDTMQRPDITEGSSRVSSRYARGKWGFTSFENAVTAMSRSNRKPVFCIDEFEVLFAEPNEFDDSFFEQLRTLTQAGVVMFVIATRLPIGEYAKTNRLTSRFFNDGHAFEVGEFSDSESAELVAASAEPRGTPALDRGDQSLALLWGGRHPYKLQLACQMLFEARQLGENSEWAKQRFDMQLVHLPSDTVEVDMTSVEVGLERPRLAMLKGVVKAILRSVPLLVGRLAQRLGMKLDDIGSWAIGAVIILLFLLIVWGVVPWRTIVNPILKSMGLPTQ